MAIKNSWSSGEVLTAADLTDTMKGVYINAQTSTSYTFGTADGFVTLSNASGGTATIPANSTAAFNTGAVIGVMNAGTAGSFTIGTAAGVTLNAVSGTTTLAPLESATLVKLATNTWQISRDRPAKIMQVVTATYATAATTTSTSFADTGLSASITPSAASSKILALVFMPFRVFNGPSAPGTGDLQVNLVRATTEVFSTASQYVAGFPSGSPEHVGNCMYSYMDSPSSTSSLTYKAQYKVSSTGSATVMIGNKTATLTLLEIGA